MAKIAFAQNTSYEYFGVMYIASVLEQKGHRVEIFLGSGNKKMLKEIIDFQPNAVGFSCTTGIHKWCLEVAKGLKEQTNVLTVFGGPHPTFFPEIINEEAVDIVCIGEGEYALLELADKIDAGEDITNVENFWVKKEKDIIKNEMRPLINHLDSLPFPDRELYYKKYPYLDRSQKAFFAGRGCPFKCTFCFEDVFRKMTAGKGRHVRIRSVDNLISEIRYVKKKYHPKTLYMQDDTFILNKKWVYEFLQKYKQQIDLPFICLIRADLIDRDMVKALKEAGCVNVFFGIETGDEKLRNNLLKKGETDEDIIRTASLLKKYKIGFRTYNMLGLPGETLEQAFKTVEINIRIKADYPWCSLFWPYPRTELGEYARTHGCLGTDINEFEPSFFRHSAILSKYKNEFLNLQKLFFYAVRFPKLFPLIKRLIKSPPNIIFDLAFLSGYAYSYLKSENITFKEMISVGVREVGSFFFARKKD